MTARAHGVAAMRGQALAHRKVGGHGALVERRHVRRRRRRRRAEDVAQHQHAAKDRRRPGRVRRDRQHAALPQQAAALAFGGERHAAEPASVDVGNSVVLRQALVEERVVRPDQSRARCDPRAARCRRRARSPAGRPAAGCRRSPGKDCAFGLTASILRSRSHCPAKLVARLNERRSASILRACFSSSSGLTQLAANGGVEQLIVRDAAPQEERQSRCQLEIADSVDAAGRYFLWVAFHAEQELRVGEHSAQRRRDSGVEIAFGARLRDRTPSARQRPLWRSAGDRRAASASRESSPAHFSSCALSCPAGRQTNNRRRLGVSPAPFGA